MASNGQSVTNRNVTMSQSYLQGVERIRKRMNTIGPLELPKQILIQREHAWDKLFAKYSQNTSNDLELNIQDSNSQSRKFGFDDGEDDDGGDGNGYFSKCRIPMRKHPALVQYWVDTGNPPYQLIDDNSSVTGSSLSEAENSKSTLLIVNRHSNVENKQANSISLYSSVDTVAYILSNTNVTKKSEAIAIIEGAKNSIISPGHSVSLTKKNLLPMNSLEDCIVKHETIDNCDYDNKIKNEVGTSNRVKLTVDIMAEGAIDDRSDCLLDRKNSTDKYSEIEESTYRSRTNQIMHNSMRITDILPTLAQFDKILNTKNIEDHQQDKVLSDDMRLFERTPEIFKQPKSFNRKKLYTERNSPIDIIVSALNNTKRLSTRINAHPALSTPTIKRNTLFSRRRTSWFQKRRKKRFSQLADALENPEKALNDGRDNETKIHDGDKVQLASSVLTRSCERMRRRTRKSSAISKKSMNNIREKRTSYDSDVSQNGTEASASNSGELRRNIKMKNLVALCSKKNLEIRLERYVGGITSPNNSSKNSIIDKQLTKLSRHSNNKSPNKVHELDLESQESDQSTILIYKCANDQDRSTTCGTESQNESQGNSDKVTKKLRSIQMRKANESNMKQTHNNVRVTTKNKKKVQKINQQSVIIRSALLLESDGDSSIKTSPLFQHRSQTHSVNSVITFSSDEEDDFLQIIRENTGKHAETSNNVISTSEKSTNSTKSNCENLINDLKDQSVEEPKIPPTMTAAINLAIVESDDEEMIGSQKVVTKTKKKITKRQEETSKESSVRTRSTCKSSNVMNTNRKSGINTVAKVLRYPSSSDSSTDNEYIVTPKKKLKLICNIESKMPRNSTREKLTNISKELVEKNSNFCDKTSRLNTKVSRWSEYGKKTSVHFANETNELSTKNGMKPISEKFPSSLELSNTGCKDVRVSVEKFGPSPSLPPSHLSLSIPTINKIHEKKKFIRCNDDIGINGNGKTKLRTQNSKELKETTVDIEYTSQNDNSSRRAKIKKVKFNGTRLDNGKLIFDSENTTKSSLPLQTNKDDIYVIPRQTIFPISYDDSSSDGSLKFDSRGQGHRVDMNDLFKNKILTFRTRSDDSDSDQ